MSTHQFFILKKMSLHTEWLNPSARSTSELDYRSLNDRDKLKKESARIITVLARNEAAITPLSNELFSKGVIPEPVYFAVLNTTLSPHDRATKLINSVLAILESHPNPWEVLEIFTDSMGSVNSCMKQDTPRDTPSGKDMHDMIIQLLSYALDTVLRVAGFSCTKMAAKSPPKKFRSIIDPLGVKTF